MENILILEDEDVSFSKSGLSEYLHNIGFSVTSTDVGHQVFAILDSNSVDLVVLGFELKASCGIDILRRIRARSGVPVVVISGEVEREKRIRALEEGADDFIVRPFDPIEIASRIRAVIRRSSGGNGNARHAALPEYRFAEWRYQESGRELTAPDGTNVPMTPAEFNLLGALIRAPMRVLSRDQLLDSIGQREEAPIGRSVDVLVSRIRKKLSERSPKERFIQTVHGYGYRFSHPVTVHSQGDSRQVEVRPMPHSVRGI
jgi:DNA-binding response OmpR family regulator